MKGENDVLSSSILVVVIVIDGWDICVDNIGDAMRKAKVLDIALQDQVYDKLSKLAPRPSIYDPDFIAANQVRTMENDIVSHRKLYRFLMKTFP